MCIFHLPASLLAHLNAKRFPWQCFRYQLMISNSSVFHPCTPSPRRPALLTAPRSAPPIFSSHLFPSPFPSDRPVAAILAPFIVSWGGAWDEARCCDPLRQPSPCRYS